MQPHYANRLAPSNKKIKQTHRTALAAVRTTAVLQAGCVAIPPKRAQHPRGESIGLLTRAAKKRRDRRAHRRRACDRPAGAGRHPRCSRVRRHHGAAARAAACRGGADETTPEEAQVIASRQIRRGVGNPPQMAGGTESARGSMSRPSTVAESVDCTVVAPAASHRALDQPAARAAGVRAIRDLGVLLEWEDGLVAATSITTSCPWKPTRTARSSAPRRPAARPCPARRRGPDAGMYRQHWRYNS